MNNIIITGANHGIGYYLTLALLEQGHCIQAIDLEVDHLEEMCTKYPHSLRIAQGDVTDKARMLQIVRAFVEEHARIDILINNACLAIFKPFEEKTIDETKCEFDVNYFGYIHMIQAVLPFMKEQGHGIIHNFSSGVGITGFPRIYGYASTKAAIESLTRTLAIELAPYGITVNMIQPPLCRTRSASPLGVPDSFLADPAEIGEKLSRNIGSTKTTITPDLQTAIGLKMNQLFPNAMGQFLARMTEKAIREAQEKEI